MIALQPPISLLRSRWAAPVCDPAVLAAVLVLALNDHWLKTSDLLPALVTGKLSDIAGLFFFPAFLLAGVRGVVAIAAPEWRLARALVAAPWLAAALATLTGIGFAAANIDPGVNAWLAGWFGVKAMDPSDLWTLPALVVSAVHARRWRDA